MTASVPSLLGDMLGYGGGMANGLMLCATTHGGATAVGVPQAMRKQIAPPPDFRKLHALPPELRALMRRVKPYGQLELQRALDLYAYAGHLANRGLEGQLRSGELASKVGLLTAGVADDVYKVCEQL